MKTLSTFPAMLVRAATALGAIALLAIGPPLYAQEVLEEIVVTAQKREESVQNVANPVTVFTGEDLHSLGIKEPRDLAMQTPGLLTKLGPNGLRTVSFYLRGVGINDFSGTVDSSVGVYVDEVYKPTPDTLNFALMDMERVEVLKGPARYSVRPQQHRRCGEYHLRATNG